MPQRVSVWVLGGRLTPNWLGILALRPDAVEFVVSSDTPARYEEACQILAQLADLDIAPEPKIVSAYSFVETRDDGMPLFDECGFSVEIPSDGARKEIDCACMYRGQLIHCSCKTELSPFRTAYLDELRTISALVGGHFTSRLFVTNALPPFETERGAYRDFQRFLAQAEDRETVVVTGNELRRIREILKREAVHPTYPRI